MVLKKNRDPKLYFSISEVAQMFDINESTLRFWEKEFDIINPPKTSKGIRYYRQEDINSVRLVYHLVKERGLTLAGARQKLNLFPALGEHICSLYNKIIGFYVQVIMFY